MARGVFELMKAPGCLKGCWCGGRWFDRLTMTDWGEGRGAAGWDSQPYQRLVMTGADGLAAWGTRPTTS